MKSSVFKLWHAMKSGYWTIMWNGRDCGASEMNYHQPQKRPVFIQGDVVYMVELERSPLLWALYCCCSVAKSCLTLQSHGLQYAKLPCPSPSPRVCPSSCPLHQWCHPTISPSVTLFSFCLQSFPATRSFPMSYSLYQVFQLQLQSFQWIFRTNFL